MFSRTSSIGAYLQPRVRYTSAVSIGISAIFKRKSTCKRLLPRTDCVTLLVKTWLMRWLSSSLTRGLQYELRRLSYVECFTKFARETAANPHGTPNRLHRASSDDGMMVRDANDLFPLPSYTRSSMEWKLKIVLNDKIKTKPTLISSFGDGTWSTYLPTYFSFFASTAQDKFVIGLISTAWRTVLKPKWKALRHFAARLFVELWGRMLKWHRFEWQASWIGIKMNQKTSQSKAFAQHCFELQKVKKKTEWNYLVS